MVALLRLKAGKANLQLAPDIGGGIVSLDLAGKPVLRPWTHNVDDGPFALASNILVPFSNRISGGGFSFQEERHNIVPNREGEQFPIHGDGFQCAWEVSERTENSVILTLNQGNIGPFRYSAAQIFSLTDNGLRVGLNVTNRGAKTLPFGCGFHPWFPRDRHTRVKFLAKGVWLEDTSHLPSTHLELADNPDWDYSRTRMFPDAGLNNAWTGWTGPALIDQGDNFIPVELTASAALDTAIIYTLKPDCDFFCFEPVSHSVDAHNMPGMPGLAVLEPNQTMTTWMQLKW